jgi:hypothetical protein
LLRGLFIRTYVNAVNRIVINRLEKLRFKRPGDSGWQTTLKGLKGTRIPVGFVLGYLAAGKTAEDIIAEFPDLTRDQIAASLDYARELAEFEAVSGESIQW